MSLSGSWKFSFKFEINIYWPVVRYELHTAVRLSVNYKITYAALIAENMVYPPFGFLKTVERGTFVGIGGDTRCK